MYSSGPAHGTLRSPRRLPHPHLSRLGVGLVVVGLAEIAHQVWGISVDLPLLCIGGLGLAWSVVAQHLPGMVAGITLVAVALFTVLDDNEVFSQPQDATTLVVLAGLLLLAHGLPARWQDSWPIVPVGALVLVGVFGLIRLVAPWPSGAPVLVLLAGLALLAWDAHGGALP